MQLREWIIEYCICNAEILFDSSERLNEKDTVNKKEGDTYMQSLAFLEPRVLLYGFNSNEN